MSRISLSAVVVRWLIAPLGLLLLSAVVGLAQDVEVDPQWRLQTVLEPNGLEVGGMTVLPDGRKAYVATFDEAKKGELESLWRQLRANLQSTGITTSLKIDGAGTVIRCKFKITQCPDIVHSQDKFAAYRNQFFARGTVSWVFGLKAKNRFAVEADNARVEFVDGAKTTIFEVLQDVTFDWNPRTKQLAIVTALANNLNQTGIHKASGDYRVQGTSTITTLAKSTSVSTSFIEKLFSVSASTITELGVKRLRVSIGGNGWLGEYGKISLIRRGNQSGGSLQLAFGAKWLTSIDMNFRESFANVTAAQCQSMKSGSISFSATDQKNGSAAITKNSGCVATNSQLPVVLKWTAKPTRNDITGALDGMEAQARFIVDWRTTSTGQVEYTSYYRPLSNSGITWNLVASVTGDAGGGINVANAKTGTQESKKINEVIFK